MNHIITRMRRWRMMLSCFWSGWRRRWQRNTQRRRMGIYLYTIKVPKMYFKST